MKKVFMLVAVAVVMLVGGIACATKITVPEGYEEASPILPAMVEHWVNFAEFRAQAQAQETLGPIYMVNKEEVIGVEYMWSKNMLQEISIPTPEGAEVFETLAPIPVGTTVYYMDITFIPEGHPGLYEVPHWVIHLYFISQEEKAAITPEG